MKIKTLSSLNQKVDMLGITVADEKLATPLGQSLDRQLGGLLSKIIKQENIGKVGDARRVDTHDKIQASTILLLGVGKENTTELIRKLSSCVARSAIKSKAQHAALEDLSFLKNISASERGQAYAEGAVMGAYRFDSYKSKKEKNTLSDFSIISQEAKSLLAGITVGEVFATSTNLARDLINTPACDMTPRRMADEAVRIGKLPQLSAKIFDKKQIEKMGMNCYLAVSWGSTQPPYLLHLTYKPTGKTPTKKTKKIVFIGKGITFDSGGLSLKTAQSMETMKDDMSGAAAMLGVMQALSALKPSIEVHGISAVTENMPSGSADKPGDIVTTMSGKTVEILNTDAEGRLTLADALTYAQQLKPDLIIDAATLTGACVVALGELCSGIMGNDEALINQLIDCGKQEGEKIWPLPLIEEYKQDLKSPIADLKNIGGRFAGTINAGLFLQEFVDSKMSWAHIDIAGPSWTEKELPYCPRGGTGSITRTILKFILNQ